jgi:hypothetical protein
LGSLDRAAFAAPLCKVTRHSELVCTTINTRREISFVWRFGYSLTLPFLQSNCSQAKPCLANQASPLAVLGTLRTERDQQSPQITGLDAVQHNDMCHQAAL